MKKLYIILFVLLNFLFLSSCVKETEDILGSSAPYRPLWVEAEFLENKRDLYFIAATTSAENNTTLVLELSLEQFKDYLKEETDIIFKNYEDVMDLETKNKIEQSYIESVYSSLNSEAIMSAQYYWERKITTSDYESGINYHLYSIITINKELLRSKQIRALQIQANNAKFNKNDAVFNYLKSQKDTFKESYQSHKIKKKHYFVLDN